MASLSDFVTTTRTDTGNVGIGTGTPTEKLTVFGNISATGTIKASNILANNTITVLSSVSNTRVGFIHYLTALPISFPEAGNYTLEFATRHGEISGTELFVQDGLNVGFSANNPFVSILYVDGYLFSNLNFPKTIFNNSSNFVNVTGGQVRNDVGNSTSRSNFYATGFVTVTGPTTMFYCLSTKVPSVLPSQSFNISYVNLQKLTGSLIYK